MGAHRRAVAAVATYRRAVNVVRAVIEQKRSLETVWGNESKKLRPPDRRWLRDLCSGALRNWYRLDAELAPIVTQEAFLEGGKAKRGVDDPELRALMVLSLYEGRHMGSSPPLAELRAKAVNACEAMDKPWALGLVGMSVVRALRNGAGDDSPSCRQRRGSACRDGCTRRWSATRRARACSQSTHRSCSSGPTRSCST